MSNKPIDDAFQKWNELNLAFSREYIAALEAENEALKIVLQGICEHIPGVPYGDLPGEVEALRKDADKMARYIVNHGRDLPDHACAQCVPHGDMLIAGFVCGYHRATVIDAARKETK